MDKTKIKNFAVRARQELIDSVRQELANYGIDQDGVKEELPISTPTIKYYTNEDFPLTGKKIQWRKQIVSRLNRDQQAKWNDRLNDFIEEVAYTWFNRIIAIRFMEVNDYLPSRTRVLSSEEGRLEPDIITHALEIEDDLGGYTDEERQFISNTLVSHNPSDMDQTFKMLFIKQIDVLSPLLPKLFEKTDDYLKLLFTPRYNHGVIKELVDDIPQDDFDVSKSGQVSIIGWLYQYYISKPHDEVINITGKKAVKKEDIPAATQLFTTDWVVKYMVDNSLGKYYLERHPNSPLRNKLEYLLPSKINEVQDNKKLESYKFIDNAMGSGHILIYAFDLLMEMYREEGYSSRESVRLILNNNLYGLEIDKRAYQLAYFAVMMKARQYDRRIFNRDIHLNLFLFKDVHLPSEFYKQLSPEVAKELRKVFADFSNAAEYGSIIHINTSYDLESQYDEISSISVDDLDLYGLQRAKELALEAINIIELLRQKYDAVVTNPPYLNKFDTILKKYLKKYYASYSKDLFSVFMVNNMRMLTQGGYAGFMTPFVWMFIKTYEPLRHDILKNKKIDSLIQMEYSAYEEATVPICTFVLKNSDLDKEGTYIRLASFKGGMDVQKEKVQEAISNPTSNYLYRTDQNTFDKIPGSPIAYWASPAIINDFQKGTPLGEIVNAKVGLQTGDNKRFLRYWYEVDFNNIYFNAHSANEAQASGKKWFPYNKGGSYRKWYGNYDYVVNWKNNGYDIKHSADNDKSRHPMARNEDVYFQEAITWSDITSGSLSARIRSYGSIHDATGMSAFKKSYPMVMILGMINSKVGNYIFKILNPTIHAQIGNFLNIPYLDNNSIEIKQCINRNIILSKEDWDKDEMSWKFNMNPLLGLDNSLAESVTKYGYELSKRIKEEQKNEEQINQYFINLYGLNNELNSQVNISDITLANPNNKNFTEIVVKKLLSYFMGCLFGRYSLEREGLMYAGGEWDISERNLFKPLIDNIVLLTDRDYFGDSRDIINRLREFLMKAFDSDHLKDNLHFIANTLSPKKVERGIGDEQIIREYFLNDFYKDHDKMYHKRPIYWQFSSGRNDGFKALMYLHRYDRNELAMARTYLHQLQEAYTNTIKLNEEQQQNADSAREKNQYRKDTAKLKKKIDEVIKYDEALQHQALAQVDIDLDDGVLVNHAKIQGNEKLLSKL